MENNRGERQDYFVFPRSFPFERMKDVVIGRVKIDNYLMALMHEMRGYLIDSTYRGETW